VRQRFALEHAQLAGDDLTLVEAAARQWFRLAARHPRAQLSMPSALVDDLWRELVRDTRGYATFCDAAFGRFLPHEAKPAMGAADATADRTTRLRHTLDLARQDEGCGARGIPLLFRVDAQLGFDGAGYVADCGGHGECYEASGTVCLQHLTGLGKQTKPGLSHPGAGPPDPYQWPNQGIGPS